MMIHKNPNFPLEIPIYFDTEKLHIIVGKHIFDEPVFGFKVGSENKFDIKELVLKTNGIDLKEYSKIRSQIDGKIGLRDVHKYFSGKLGPFFNRRLRAYSYELWIKPYEEVIRRNNLVQFCYGQQADSQPFLIKFHKCIDKVIQAENNKNHHLIPLIIHFKKDEAELKEFLGDDLWQILCSQSKTRNMIIAKWLEDCASELPDNVEQLRALICKITQMKSSFFPVFQELIQMKPSYFPLFKNVIYAGRYSDDTLIDLVSDGIDTSNIYQKAIRAKQKEIQRKLDSYERRELLKKLYLKVQELRIKREIIEAETSRYKGVEGALHNVFEMS